ncbi:MAG: ornithine carbamoyltransferase [Gammaproteobacteria bacterium]|nr:ornithine carbamoyltransferase [Gammaproteobacteria bacterium]|tara:strand:+ start:96035 stop:96952 length:918 start_codon:yes stop_codon:yes gene_type:complete
MNKVRHFKSLLDVNKKEFLKIINNAIDIKNKINSNEKLDLFKNKTLAMIFKKNSTRTRIAFEVAMSKMGGHAIFLSEESSQISRGENLSDTAKVLSGMVDLVLIRTSNHNDILELSNNSDVPIINGLSNMFHPCQLLADIQTFTEIKGSIENKKVAWIGDGCNMCNSYINAAKILDFNLKISIPTGYEPDERTLELASDHVELCDLPGNAVEDCDLVTTDVWASMGLESESDKRKNVFKGYQVNSNLMSKAKKDAIFMHCLPAHRGEEVEADVIDGKQSVVWQQAHNRLYTSIALIDFLLNENSN